MKLLASLAFLLSLAAFAAGQGEPQGTVKATTKIRPDGSSATTIVDPEKRTAEESISDSAGKVMKKTVFLLDERNFATGAIHYDGKGNIRYKETYKRDGADRIAESILFSANDRPLGRRVFSYDARGNAQILDYDAQGVALARPQPATTSRGRPDKKRR